MLSKKSGLTKKKRCAPSEIPAKKYPRERKMKPIDNFAQVGKLPCNIVALHDLTSTASANCGDSWCLHVLHVDANASCWHKTLVLTILTYFILIRPVNQTGESVSCIAHEQKFISILLTFSSVCIGATPILARISIFYVNDVSLQRGIPYHYNKISLIPIL